MNILIRVFEEILYLGVIASIPLLLILLMKKIFHKVVSPKWHYYIWVLLIIRLMVPILPESSLSVLNLVYAVTEQSNLVENQVGDTILYGPKYSVRNNAQEAQVVTGDTVTNSNEALQQENSSSSPRATEQKFTVQAIFAVVWIIGVIILGGYTIYANIAFAIKLRRYYRKLTDPRMDAIFDECKRLLKVKGRITLYTTPIARTPSLYTALHTRILLSEEHMKNLSDREIRYIFLHELIHYRRKDIVVNWLVMFLQIIYFFQPLLWYAFLKIHEDCEISCDAEVLKYFGEDIHQEYGNTILKLLRLHADSGFIPVTAGIGKHKSSYRRRIIMIKQFKRYRWTNTMVTFVLIMAVGLVGLTGCNLKASGNNTPDAEQTVAPEESAENESGSIGTPTPIISETPNQVSQEDDAISSADPSPAEDMPDTKPDVSAESQAVYYGDWTIRQVIAFGQSGTYSKEDAEGLIGREMSFSADGATTFGDQASYIDVTIKDPVYTATEYTSSDFIGYYRMSFDLLGLTGDTVTEITATDAEGNRCTFLIKDENTLIVVGGGTYFELVRK
ncbi:MAG: peptidase BlaR1 [Herbinix sp.]|nr:peptidase BlaR1 [Herbinix sp.]